MALIDPMGAWIVLLRAEKAVVKGLQERVSG